KNRIETNGVVVARTGSKANSGQSIESNVISRCRRCATDDVVVRAVIDKNSLGQVGETGCPRRIRSDVIPLNLVCLSGRSRKNNPLLPVSRDDIAGGRGRAADLVVAGLHHDAAIDVLLSAGAGRVGADKVPLNSIAAKILDKDANAAGAEGQPLKRVDD